MWDQTSSHADVALRWCRIDFSPDTLTNGWREHYARQCCLVC